MIDEPIPIPTPVVEKPPVRTSPKWQQDAMERLKAGIKKFSKPLADLAGRDANEGDTRMIVTDFLCEALGYDKYSDLTTEYRVKAEFADYGIRIDKEMIAFLEVKRVNTKLSSKHLRQVETYALNEGVEWVMLTNGADWQVYHLTPSLPMVIDLVISVNLLGEETTAQKAQKLFPLTRESLKRKQIAELWEAMSATSPKSLIEVLMTDSVLESIRREVKRKSGHKISKEEVGRLLKETVIRPECS
jgi:predicted type IV restriction endonuclease